MARDSADDFRIHLGRARGRAGRADTRFRPFVKLVEAAIRKAGGNPSRIGGPAGKRSGRFNARGRGARLSFPRDGAGWQRDSAGRFRARRVVVKARVVKLNRQRSAHGPKMPGHASKAADAHLRYLERDGVTRDGDKGHAYSALEDAADSRAFLARGRDDRHQFRFIVAPEDAAELATELGDLRGFTRDLMRQVEQDLDTGLDWIAVDHHNTGHSHTHIIVRGVTGDGKILNIVGDYIAHGIRHRASELATRELGHQSEIDVACKLASEIRVERLTRLDRMLIAEQRDHGFVDLRPGEGQRYLVRENRHLLIGRAKRLERYGLTTEQEPGCWLISDGAESALKALGARHDIVDTIHRALADHGLAEERGIDQPFPSLGGPTHANAIQCVNLLCGWRFLAIRNLHCSRRCCQSLDFPRPCRGVIRTCAVGRGHAAIQQARPIVQRQTSGPGTTLERIPNEDGTPAVATCLDPALQANEQRTSMHSCRQIKVDATGRDRSAHRNQ